MLSPPDIAASVDGTIGDSAVVRARPVEDADAIRRRGSGAPTSGEGGSAVHFRVGVSSVKTWGIPRPIYSSTQVCLRPETTEPDPGEGAGEEGRERERETLYFPLPSS